MNWTPNRTASRTIDCCDVNDCQLEGQARAVVGERRAAPHPDDSIAAYGFWASVGLIAACFAFGFLLLFVGIWLQDDPESGSLVAVGLVGGALFAFGGLCMLLWEKGKAASNRSRRDRFF